MKASSDIQGYLQISLKRGQIKDGKLVKIDNKLVLKATIDSLKTFKYDVETIYKKQAEVPIMVISQLKVGGKLVVRGFETHERKQLLEKRSM